MYQQDQYVRYQGAIAVVKLVLGSVDTDDYLIRQNGIYKPVVHSEIELVEIAPTA